MKKESESLLEIDSDLKEWCRKANRFYSFIFASGEGADMWFTKEQLSAMKRAFKANEEFLNFDLTEKLSQVFTVEKEND